MALSGIQIFKLLPKTNCGECGVPTCLAFAMNLAAGKADLSKCPYVSEETKAKLGAESAPPIRTVEIGAGAAAVKVGGETVLFRHEKTFFNKTALAVTVSDDEPDAAVDAKLKRFAELSFLRVGLTLKADLLAVRSKTGDPARFAALARKAAATGAPLILMADKADILAAGLKECAGKRPLLWAATAANADAVFALAKEHKTPVVVRGDGVDAVAALADKAAAAGLQDLVLDTGAAKLGRSLADQTAIRRLAVWKKHRSVGYPTLLVAADVAADPLQEALVAAAGIAKYAGIVVLSDARGDLLFPLLLERLNIFTDPQRPMKTDPGIYELNKPGAESPVMITSNFSLTYFIVSGEIEASRVPSYLLILDTDGLSVLTAWAAGKFVGDAVGMFVKKCGIAGKVSKRRLILPGAVAVISGDVEEELGSDWEVKIGPREAANLTPYLRAL
jgi:acetyl-CoA decarbonylase/synthase, CODH/ACS complex subunit gamma